MAPIEELVTAEAGARLTLGFRSDAAFVQDLETRRRRGDNSVQVVANMALTIPEADEMRSRLRVQDNSEALANYATDFPDSHAGMYIDRPKAVAVVRFTRDAPLRAAELATKFNLSDRLRVIDARWSLKDLDVTAQAIMSRTEDLNRLGTKVVSTSILPTTNSLVVSLDHLSDAVTDYFRTNFVAGQVSIEAAQQSKANATLTAGTWVDNLTWNSGCTFGFSYKTPAGGYGVLTAGHCGQAGHIMAPASDNSQTYGVFGSSWGSGTATDSLALPTNLGALSNYIATGEKIVSLGGSTSDPVGTFLCKYGHVTLTRCGTVEYIRSSTPAGADHLPDTTITWMRQMWLGYCGAETGGDSGGPVWLSGKAYGLIQGTPANGCGDWAYYTAASYATAYWGVIIPIPGI